MNAVSVLMLALLFVAAPAAAEALEPDHEPLDHGEDDGDHDSPGLGLVALVGAIGAVAYARRR